MGSNFNLLDPSTPIFQQEYKFVLIFHRTTEVNEHSCKPQVMKCTILCLMANTKNRTWISSFLKMVHLVLNIFQILTAKNLT